MASAAKPGTGPRRLRLRVGDEWFAVEVQDTGPGAVRVLVNDEPVNVEWETVDEEAPAPSPGRPTHVENRDLNPPVYHVLENHMRLGVESETVAQASPAAPPPPVAPPSTVGDPKRIVAPMPGRVISVGVNPGDQVAAGDEVALFPPITGG